MVMTLVPEAAFGAKHIVPLAPIPPSCAGAGQVQVFDLSSAIEAVTAASPQVPPARSRFPAQEGLGSVICQVLVVPTPVCKSSAWFLD